MELSKNKIVQAWLVLMLALLFGGALAGVQMVLGPTIETNKINETRQKVPELVEVPAGEQPKVNVEPKTIEVEKNGKKTIYNVFQAFVDGRPVGWVAKSGGQGYADKIELLIGFDPALQTITGVFVLDQKETPGLGNKIIEPSWRGQFENKSTTRPLEVVKTGAENENEINAITGATISSRTVAGIVNSAVNDLKGPLTD
ncbi:MAG: FMN-binding protein [Desulfobacterales bacterium]